MIIFSIFGSGVGTTKPNPVTQTENRIDLKAMAEDQERAQDKTKKLLEEAERQITSDRQDARLILIKAESIKNISEDRPFFRKRRDELPK